MTPDDPHARNVVAGAVMNAHGEWVPCSLRYRIAEKVLEALAPVVASEVRKAKAEAWDEGWEHRDTPDDYAWDGEQDVPLVPSRYVNPYRETGAQR